MILAIVLFWLLMALIAILSISFIAMTRLEEKGRAGTKAHKVATVTAGTSVVLAEINFFCLIGAFICGMVNEPAQLTREELKPILGKKEICCSCNHVFLHLPCDETNEIKEWGGLVTKYVCDDCLAKMK